MKGYSVAHSFWKTGSSVLESARRVRYVGVCEIDPGNKYEVHVPKAMTCFEVVVLTSQGWKR